MIHVIPARDLFHNLPFFTLPIRGKQHRHGSPDSLSRRVAEQPLGAGIPARDDPFQCLADDCVIGRLDDGPNALCARLQLRGPFRDTLFELVVESCQVALCADALAHVLGCHSHH